MRDTLSVAVSEAHICSWPSAAKIFSRQITKWDDPEIKALNPDMTATEEIMVVHRKKGSSSTSGFTEYLDKKCPSEWSGKANGCGPTGCVAK